MADNDLLGAIGACIPGAVFSIVSRNVGLKLLRFCTEV